MINEKLEALGPDFIGGAKPSIGDFILFSMYSLLVFNQNSKVPDLRNSIRAEMVDTPTVSAWVKRMQGELNDYLEKRPPHIL